MAQPQAQSVISLAIKGLFLNPSTFGSNVPQGALQIADNVVIDRPSVVATRRGLDNSFATLPTGSSSVLQYNGAILVHGTNNTMYVDPIATGTFSAYSGTYTVPDNSDTGSRVRGVEANKNFYFITGEGTYRLDSPTNQPRLAGAPPGLSGTGVTTGATGFFPNNTNIAYRIVFGYQDQNKQLVLGAPSSRILVTNNSGGTRNVTVTFQVPKEIQANPANFFYRAYRSAASANLATPASDDMNQVYQDVTTGAATITFTDIVPSTLVGAALYTNASNGEGIQQSNYRPPHANDICLFKQFTFYANTRTAHEADVTLVTAGATNGADALVPGNTVTVTSTDFGGPSFVLTAATSNNFALGQFAVSNTGNPALDIQVTAQNMVLVANAYPSNTFIAAYYSSNEDELPGKMTFVRLDLSTVAFTFNSSNANAWDEILPLTSTNNVNPNRIYYSKINQPEAVPLPNYIDVGSANKKINRIVPLRDGVMVLKQDGVFRISNAVPPFTVTPIDFNTKIIADNTAVDLDNNVYFLSDQGIVALSDSDTQIMSFVLDKTIIENTSPDLFPNIQSVAWGLAYQSARKYILFMPSTGADTQSTQQYVYNHITVVWTRWTLEASSGIVLNTDGKMYLGSTTGSAPGVGNSYVYQERKSFTTADYVDNEYLSNTATTGFTDTIVIPNITLPFGTNILPGWTVQQQTSGQNFIVESATIGMIETTIKLTTPTTWTAQAIKLYTPIYTEVQTIQVDCQNPGMNKQFSECIFVFTEQGFDRITLRYTSDTTNVPAVDYITPNTVGGWGIDPWGVVPWGGGTSGQGKRRRYVPQTIQRAGWVYINIQNAQAFTSFGLSGYEMIFKSTSTRNR